MENLAQLVAKVLMRISPEAAIKTRFRRHSAPGGDPGLKVAAATNDLHGARRSLVIPHCRQRGKAVDRSPMQKPYACHLKLPSS